MHEQVKEKKRHKALPVVFNREDPASARTATERNTTGLTCFVSSFLDHFLLCSSLRI
jgi:hypothetical protein